MEKLEKSISDYRLSYLTSLGGNIFLFILYISFGVYLFYKGYEIYYWFDKNTLNYPFIFWGIDAAMLITLLFWYRPMDRIKDSLKHYYRMQIAYLSFQTQISILYGNYTDSPIPSVPPASNIPPVLQVEEIKSGSPLIIKYNESSQNLDDKNSLNQKQNNAQINKSSLNGKNQRDRKLEKNKYLFKMNYPKINFERKMSCSKQFAEVTRQLLNDL